MKKKDYREIEKVWKWVCKMVWVTRGEISAAADNDYTNKIHYMACTIFVLRIAGFLDLIHYPEF